MGKQKAPQFMFKMLSLEIQEAILANRDVLLTLQEIEQRDKETRQLRFNDVLHALVPGGELTTHIWIWGKGLFQSRRSDRGDKEMVKAKNTYFFACYNGFFNNIDGDKEYRLMLYEVYQREAKRPQEYGDFERQLLRMVEKKKKFIAVQLGPNQPLCFLHRFVFGPDKKPVWSDLMLIERQGDKAKLALPLRLGPDSG